MKKITFSLLTILLFNISIFSASKIDRIAIINIQQVIETLFSADKVSNIKSIKEDKDKMQENLNKIREDIVKAEETKINTTDNNTKKVLEKKIEDLKKQYADYYKFATMQIEQKIKNSQEPLFKEIYDVAKRIAELEGYSLILEAKMEGIIYYSADNDITQKVITTLNARGF